MPLPRKPRQSRPTDGTRASRRHVREMTWLQTKLVERFAALAALLETRRKHTYRGAYGAFIYLKEGDPVPPGLQKVEFDEDGREIDCPAHEKAPGLAAEGSSDIVIPGEDPGSLETQAFAAVPARRATRLSGMTVLTD